MEPTHGKTRGRATLNDIARTASVSVSTVSLVLSGKAKERRISDDVTARVLRVAAEMDYAPNLLVRSLQRGRTHVLSFFSGFRNRDPDDLYMDRLSTAVERAGGRYGYDILVYCDFRRSTLETYRTLNGGHSDGLIFFAPQPGEPLLPHLRASRLPVVLTNVEDEAGVLSSVRSDQEDGMRQVTDRLLALGHRRIAVFTDAAGGNPDAAARVALLRARLAEAGVTLPDSRVLPLVTPWTDAGATVRRLLSEPEPPTALFCWHDRVGYQVLEQCEQEGISIPEQLSLVSYDGLRWPAMTRHTLASVRVDLDELAEAAVTLADRLIRGAETPPVRQMLPATLTPGTTLGPPT